MKARAFDRAGARAGGLLAWILTLGGCALAPATLAQRPGLLVPFYIAPDRSWDLLAQARLAHPQVPLVVIVNPASGPGEAPDPSYEAGIRKLQASGILVLGYVATTYGKKDPSRVQGEVDRWKSWYRVDGVFYDEMASEPEREAYYRALGREAKARGLGLTVGNPGCEIPESFVGAFDAFVIYEDAGLPELGSLGGWHARYPRKTWGILPHTVKAVDRAFLRRATATVGLIYVTDLPMPDPWERLPSYLNDLLAALEACS